MQFIGGFESGVIATGKEEYAPSGGHVVHHVVIRSNVETVIIKTAEFYITVCDGVVNVVQRGNPISGGTIMLKHRDSHWDGTSEKLSTVKGVEVERRHEVPEELGSNEKLSTIQSVEMEQQRKAPVELMDDESLLMDIESYLHVKSSSKVARVPEDVVAVSSSGVEETKDEVRGPVEVEKPDFMDPAWVVRMAREKLGKENQLAEEIEYHQHW